ncbi:hypothetical protein HRI_000919800 [Hibiscus trionum]|uniref:Tyrosinase copper-binding domain-containing protein n=1 Tax=Hibiscus trionum TaxID=183268 RepID=A0A9W7HAY0_HIBTR|nr:hypothetical protein HRI_000919800 [Hibiscus trionum]
MASTLNSPSSLFTLPISSIQTPFLPKTPELGKKKPFNLVSKRAVSCKANNGKQNNDDSSSSLGSFDRRDVLLGLGSLYGATNLVSDPFALAAPIYAPDLSQCGDATVPLKKSPGTNVSVHCCPPISTNIIDFKPPEFTKIRSRPAAHLVDAEYVEKFQEAIKRMKALDEKDPRNFTQQAKVHCAYCNSAYEQMGFPSQDLQIHNSWLFFPFHRLYLYFYERILGKLIGDPDFALPFWNWDSPKGMTIPAIYADSTSSVYDAKRNASHQPPVLVDLDYSSDKNLSKEEMIKANLCVMYRQMVKGSKTKTLFHGKEYRMGYAPDPGAGTIENGIHLSVHKWVGDPTQPLKEDMGNFYSAGYDPLFYAHHANLDRMWNLWKTKLPKQNTDFTDADWLDSSFLFYDENANLVRVRVRDCIDSKNLGYDYQSVNIPWLESKPTPLAKSKLVAHRHSPGQAIAAEANNIIATSTAFPIVLDKPVRVEVPRQKKTTVDDDEEEVLILQNIQLDRDSSVKFDVCINITDTDTPVGPGDSEFVGSYTNIPHGHHHQGSKLNTYLSFPISDALEELELENEAKIVVTLLPKEGEGLVSIGNIKIDRIRD